MPSVRNRVMPEADCPEDGLAATDGAALRGHHLQPEDGHAERLAAHRPLVGEVEELPEREHDEGRQLVVGQRVASARSPA